MNKVTRDGIEAKIKSVKYSIIDGTTVTLCHVELVNGFSIRGESACVDPANFDKGLGEKYAYEDAFKKLWLLEGYLLKQKMYEDSCKGA